MDKDTQKHFNQKMRICLLGEPSMMTQSHVIELCKKFFIYGMEYEKKKLNDKK